MRGECKSVSVSFCPWAQAAALPLSLPFSLSNPQSVFNLSLSQPAARVNARVTSPLPWHGAREEGGARGLGVLMMMEGLLK